MKNLENIKKSLSFINELGVSIEDLVAYSNNHTETENLASPEQDPSSRTILPLEVLYSDDTRSFFFEPLKTPIAIICGNVGFAFEDAPRYMNWHDADKYCEKYSVGGKKWKLPNYESGHLKVLYENKVSINEVLTAFGKKCLKEDWYWASEFDNYSAWSIRFSDGYVHGNFKYGYGSVRPVLAL